jgi:predicted transcriptional regulator
MEYRVSSFPVVNKADEVIGVVSEADLRQSWHSVAATTTCRA